MKYDNKVHCIHYDEEINGEAFNYYFNLEKPLTLEEKSSIRINREATLDKNYVKTLKMLFDWSE
jgi:hypothetical protein